MFFLRVICQKVSQNLHYTILLARTPDCQPQAPRASQVSEEVSEAASVTKAQAQEENVRREEDGHKEKVCKETVTSELQRSTRTSQKPQQVIEQI